MTPYDSLTGRTPRKSFREFWDHLHRVALSGFHTYAAWLTRLSWWRFFLFSILLIIISGILSELPPFSWHLGKSAEKKTHKPAVQAVHPRLSGPLVSPAQKKTIDVPKTATASSNFSISMDDIQLKIQIESPADTGSEGVEQTLDEVKSALEEVQAALESKNIPKGLIDIQASEDNTDEADDEDDEEDKGTPEPTTLGEHLPKLALLLIFCSIPLKVAYQGQQRAEATAARALQDAETQTLRRQVIEARLSAMQAQVEPHFLFNTLGSIEHLIETDPTRAARMQRSLITFLREAMPTLRETQTPTFRNLGRELAIVVPYLELLKMRMEERLRTEIRIPEGLLSAEFPPMMLQSLVENAIRHGLEPQPEGCLITVDAGVVDGRLTVSVSDTGVGFGKSNTAGSGVGLTNIRERLRLLYGDGAQLRTACPASGGTLVTIEIPYRSRSEKTNPIETSLGSNPSHESRIA